MLGVAQLKGRHLPTPSLADVGDQTTVGVGTRLIVLRKYVHVRSHLLQSVLEASNSQYAKKASTQAVQSSSESTGQVSAVVSQIRTIPTIEVK